MEAMSAFDGRWDLTVRESEGCFPSWLEIGGSGGRFVGRFGSARPLASVTIEHEILRFSLPKQYEGRSDDLIFQGRLLEGALVGTTTLDDGVGTVWTGERAPLLPSKKAKVGPAVELIGADLSNWRPRSISQPNHWSIVDGELVNAAVGSDLVSLDEFEDFKLTAEYRYPKGSNSGIYLRGRYEFQILDDYSPRGSGAGSSGAIYGFLAPSTNPILPPDEWNRAEITLMGRWITVVLNGVTVIENQEIPGITGGALDSAEGAPGPIFVQGDHGPVTFRRLTMNPI